MNDNNPQDIFDNYINSVSEILSQVNSGRRLRRQEGNLYERLIPAGEQLRQDAAALNIPNNRPVVRVNDQLTLVNDTKQAFEVLRYMNSFIYDSQIQGNEALITNISNRRNFKIAATELDKYLAQARQGAVGNQQVIDDIILTSNYLQNNYFVQIRRHNEENNGFIDPALADVAIQQRALEREYQGIAGIRQQVEEYNNGYNDRIDERRRMLQEQRNNQDGENNNNNNNEGGDNGNEQYEPEDRDDDGRDENYQDFIDLGVLYRDRRVDINEFIRKSVRGIVNEDGIAIADVPMLRRAMRDSNLKLLQMDNRLSTIEDMLQILEEERPIDPRDREFVENLRFNVYIRPRHEIDDRMAQWPAIRRLEIALSTILRPVSLSEAASLIRTIFVDNRALGSGPMDPFNGYGEAIDYNEMRRYHQLLRGRQYDFRFRVSEFRRQRRPDNGIAYGWNVDSSKTHTTFKIAGVRNVNFVVDSSPNVRDGRSYDKSPNCVIIAVNIILANRLSHHFGDQYCKVIREQENLNSTEFLNLDKFYYLYHKYKTLAYPDEPVSKPVYAYTEDKMEEVLRSKELDPYPIIGGVSILFTSQLNEILIQFLEGRRDLLICAQGHISVAQRAYFSIPRDKTTVPLVMNAEGTPILPEAAVNSDYTRHNRTFLFYDFETYNDYSSSNNETKTILRDVICHAGFVRGDSHDPNYLSFTTSLNETTGYYKTSGRKFLDFLSDEIRCPTKFTCVAHNSANFDHYFLLMAMTDTELHEVLDNGIVKLGSSILQFEYKGHKFIDSCKFLTNSLHNVCKAYLHDREDLWKTTNVVFTPSDSVIPISMTSVQLCFYKNDERFPFDEFIRLQHEPIRTGHNRFWDVYNQYCKQDVTALMMVWTRFNDAITELLKDLCTYPALFNGVIDKYTVMGKGNLQRAMTTGNHHMSILKALNHRNPLWAEVKLACPADYCQNRFINMYKIGGMSISHQKGLFNRKLIAYDIKSLYPSSLLYGLYPAGKCTDVSGNTYDIEAPGIFELRDLVFSRQAINQKFHIKAINQNSSNLYTLRPVLELDDEVLNTLRHDFYLSETERTWYSPLEFMKHTYASSIAIKYMQDFMGLISFTVCRGIQWEHYVHGSSIFGNHILSCYKIKDAEDRKKSAGLPYNSAKREAVKLGMNALTGKLGQSPLKGVQLELDAIVNDANSELLTGTNRNVRMIVNGSNVNTSTTDMSLYMIYIYEHSKLTMFSYLKHLPNGYNDLIAIETDSIHTFEKNRKAFERAINDQSHTSTLRKTFIIDVPQQYATYLNNKSMSPFIHDPVNKILNTRELGYVREGYLSIKPFPNFEAGDHVSKLGTLAVDKEAERGIYLSKKKYALYNNKWSFRLSGMKPFTTNPDGTLSSILDINTFADILTASVEYQEIVFANDSSEETLERERTRRKTSQYSSHLNKNAEVFLIHSTTVRKSVSPVINVKLVDPRYPNVSKKRFLEEIERLRQ